MMIYKITDIVWIIVTALSAIVYICEKLKGKDDEKNNN